MRDDTARWAPPRADGLDLQIDELRLTRLVGLHQTLVSGTGALTHFETQLGPAIGWPNPAQGTSYVVALRRDRALLIDGPELQDGWDAEAGLAISDMRDGYAAFEISGPRWRDLLARGTEMSPSRSAMRRFGDMDVILYAYQDALRVHVERARAEQFALWVERTASGMD